MTKIRKSAFRTPKRTRAAKRKSSPKARNFKCGEVYHVYQRGNFGRPVFRTQDEMAAYLNNFFFLCRRHKVRVHNFCLMKTHVHFVLEQRRRNAISKLMRDLQGHHTRKQNFRLHTFGNLWNHHFCAKHVSTNAYYRTLMWYVSNNPVKAGICKRVEDYPWSGACALAAGGESRFAVQKSTVKIELYMARFRAQCEPETWAKTVNQKLPAELAEQIDTIELIYDRKMLLFHVNQERVAILNAARNKAHAERRLQKQLGSGAYRQRMAKEKAKAAAGATGPASPS